MNFTLRPSKAPSLPLPPNDYSRSQQEQFANALRLYFNELDNAWASVLGTNGGQFFQFPHIAASDSTDQYATGSNVPTIVKFNTLDTGSGFTLNAPGSAAANVSGIYKITYSAELANTANAVHDAVFWLKIDTGSGPADIPNSATFFSVPARKSAGVPSYVCGYSEVVFAVNAGDIVSLWWATDLAYAPSPLVEGVYIHAEPAQTVPYVRPSIPSVIGSITFVSRLPA